MNELCNATMADEFDFFFITKKQTCKRLQTKAREGSLYNAKKRTSVL